MAVRGWSGRKLALCPSGEDGRVFSSRKERVWAVLALMGVGWVLADIFDWSPVFVVLVAAIPLVVYDAVRWWRKP